MDPKGGDEKTSGFVVSDPYIGYLNTPPLGATVSATSWRWNGVPPDGGDLTSEYTTAQLISDTDTLNPPALIFGDSGDSWTSFGVSQSTQTLTQWSSPPNLTPNPNPSVQRTLKSDESEFSFGKMRYQFQFSSAVPATNPLTLNWFVVFTPEDSTGAPDPNNALVAPMSCMISSGSTTPIYEVNPKNLQTLANSATAAIAATAVIPATATTPAVPAEPAIPQDIATPQAIAFQNLPAPSTSGYDTELDGTYSIAQITVTQINYPSSVGAGSVDSGQSANQVIYPNANGVALITGASAMPQLMVKINGMDNTGFSVDWSFSVTSERPERGDKDNIPVGGGTPPVTNVPINQAWGMNNSFPAAPQECFGGNVIVYYRIKKSDGSYLTGPQQISFKIRGLNPAPAQAYAYIQAEPLATTTLYYAWGIAKWESGESGFTYCQFNPTGANAELPNFTGSDGWGIFQRDDSGGPGAIYVATDQVYSWKVNSDVAVQQELVQKRNAVLVYLANLQSANPTQYAQDPPPPYTTSNGTVFSAVDTLTMETYNGAGTFPSLLQFNPQNSHGSRWVWGTAGVLPNALGSDHPEPYVDKVAEQMTTSP